MLIEAAIRSGRQAEAAFQKGDWAAASVPLMRVIEIMEELLAAVRKTDTPLNRKIADFYLFLFRRLSEAKINDDTAKLTEALGLLEFEQQTWQLVCDKLASDPPIKSSGPIGLPMSNKPSAAASRFSVEA